MIKLDGEEYVQRGHCSRNARGDVVRMRVHRGGGYHGPKRRSSSIHEGGDWTEKEGVVVVRQEAFASLTADPDAPPCGNPDGEVLDRWGHPSPCWVYFFDGDMQATRTLASHEYFPDGVKTFLRRASHEELGWAEAPGPHAPFVAAAVRRRHEERRRARLGDMDAAIAAARADRDATWAAWQRLRDGGQTDHRCPEFRAHTRAQDRLAAAQMARWQEERRPWSAR